MRGLKTGSRSVAPRPYTTDLPGRDEIRVAPEVVRDHANPNQEL